MDFNTLKKILKYSSNLWIYYAITIASAIINVMTNLLIPIIIGQAIDYININGTVDFNNIKLIIIKLVIIIFVSALFNFIMNKSINNIAYKTVRRLRMDAFNKVLRLDVSYVDLNSHGDVLTRVIYDTEQVTEGLLQSLQQLFTGVITIITTLAFMIYMDYLIALIVLLMTPLSIISASVIAKKSFKVYKAQADVKGNMTSLINEMFNNQNLIRVYNYTDTSIDRFVEINNQLNIYGFKSQMYGALVNPLTRVINALIYAVVVIVGALNIIMSRGMGVGNLYTFLSYSSQYTKPFNEISGVIGELQSSLSSGKRVFELIESKEPIKYPSELEEVKLSGDVSIKDLSFGYSKDKLILKNINLEAIKGSMIAIVGKTGSGKTTLINLLMRFYEPTSGHILIDGIDITKITKKGLRDNVGNVLQDSWLFEGTIFENISYSKKDATLEEVIEVCKKAYVHDYIMQLSDGYQTIVSNSGMSEGQKQLICIARIMLRLPNILLLDEATSDIDTRTEIMVQKALSNLMKGRTSFVIAHRLQTIIGADKIVVMKDGTIAEIGNHKELIDKKGVYFDIYNSQFVE